MSMKKMLLLVSIVCLVSCASDVVDQKPSNIIDKELFVQVLAEMQIAETAYQKSKGKPMDKKTQLIGNNKAILEEFQISRSTFDSSMFYYRKDQKEMMAIYDSVIVLLENKLAGMEDNKAKVN
ncbi:MAG: hypothetical protein ACJAUV_000321 [Flavobacteriales bacterium]|jgi:hypothetical protein